jgi:N-hydroxyarylamine O-acetyltransferase
MAIPFENLSIHWGEPIILTDEALFDKIVTRRRGGFCYELNGLFAALLRSLGFTVAMLSARTANDAGQFSVEFDHMTLMVLADSSWLVDVGFGDTFRKPLLLEVGVVQRQNGRDYLIKNDGEFRTLMEYKAGDGWRAQYRFDLEPYQYADYEQRCHYHQTSPESHFTQKRVCSRATPAGRLTLSGETFITTTSNGERQERLLGDEDEVAQILQEYFGITTSH